jgi:hypothetical protein
MKRFMRKIALQDNESKKAIQNSCLVRSGGPASVELRSHA